MVSRPRLDNFQRWALITTAATYGLIGVGGLVRAAGAGLGCPDWPKCFGVWIPPTDVSQLPPEFDPAQFNVLKTWIEYANRLVGAFTGLLIFGTLVLAIRHYRRVPRVLYPTVAAFFLVGFEGWLGGQVVFAKLAPLVLSAHMALALVIVSLLLYATVCAFFDQGRPLANLPKFRHQIGRGAVAVSVLALVQVAVGAVVRGEVQLVAKTVPIIDRSEWLAHAGVIYGVHRALAVVVTLAIVALAWFALEKTTQPWLRRASVVCVVLAVLQPITGLGLARFHMQPVLQVAHLWLGSLLLGALTVVALLAYRLAPTDR